jgi:predicted dehydrogenase
MAKRVRKKGGIRKSAVRRQAPDLDYKPHDPRRTNPPIALVGCGGITSWHLKAYRAAGYKVVALCDLDAERAEARRKEFYPKASVYTDYRDVLKRDDVEVVDVATHPHERLDVIEKALKAGKHVLSQKPFVLDLATGERLADLAEKKGLRLAVNQNGRWAPHFSYIRAAVAEGHLGDLMAAHFAVHWDHSWVAGTPFENISNLILYDFAIHWFDLITCLMGSQKPRQVFATVSRTVTQAVEPPLLAQAVIEYDNAQASVVFDAETRHGCWETAYVAGSTGSIRSEGRNSRNQRVTFFDESTSYRPKLEGTWFPDGFHGAMGELLCAIEEKREPSHSARNNLESLALCFAAVASAEKGKPMVPGSVRKMM